MSRRGLTFVELLIAATMLSILMVGVGGHLQGGVVVWRRTTQTVERVQRQRTALEQLSRDLASAVRVEFPDPAPPSVQALLGSSDLRFFTVRPSRDPTLGAQLRLVSYRVEQTEEGSALVKESQTLREALAGVSAGTQTVLPSVATIEIRYAYLSTEPTSSDFDWRGDWRYPEDLPRLLELTVRLAPAQDEPSQESDVSFSSKLVIPSGVMKPYEQPAGTP